MTPDDARRRQWYVDQAECNGESAAEFCEVGWAGDDEPRGFARLAGHFGRLALGQTYLEDLRKVTYSHEGGLLIAHIDMDKP